ncbi:MAG TPA: cytoplasmic protein [Candidatus Paceibacterota bacterium]|nr:cytoplasmic protein [Verrucomicrobiota bacterium]HRY51418.1 cytoplasmic protein [Candidatus Paceibacterota bacterium]HSA02212.1 cytoplasmic protein [Candidatus Paceibacterota bacterium]
MKKDPDDQNPAQVDLERLIAEITVDAHGDDEQLWAFQQAFQDNVSVPCDGFVIGQPVSVLAFDYDGNKRRGLTARCRREDGSEHVVAASEVVLPPRAKGVRFLAAYRQWLGLEPWPREATIPGRRQRQHKVAPTDLELKGPVELAVLSVKESTARCRLLGADRILTLRTRGLWKVVPGEIVAVAPGKQWSYAGHPYLSGKIESVRLDIAALDLVPLRLKERGPWQPDDHYWGEEGEPIEDWAQPIIARGPRPAFEMEQVLPGMDPNDFDSDPISESNDLQDAGDHPGARRLLMELCQADLRCLDAHAHLGNLAFDHSPKDAIHHFEVGVRIGELSIGADFDGLLPWGHIDNRPFLRCLHGFGLCLWRLERFDEAGRIFERMLWLNPTDNQGARFLVDAVGAKKAWEDDRERR